ncbi:hypothetical protein EG829_01275 [bacterium]|nr:hypothetical protein [bacterium]
MRPPFLSDSARSLKNTAFWLCGGGSLIKGMAERLEDVTRIRVNTAANPLEAVVRGAHAVLPIITILNGWTKR